MSNLILNRKVKWVVFHGQYDFSYLLKIILGTNLPNDPKDFMSILEFTFPVKFDIKIMIHEIEEIKNYSLQKLGNDLSIERHGRQHQGGSDALLTLGKYFFNFILINSTEIYHKLRKKRFKGKIPDKMLNKIFGIGGDQYHASTLFSQADMMNMQYGYTNYQYMGYPPQFYQNRPVRMDGMMYNQPIQNGFFSNLRPPHQMRFG